MVTVKRFPNNKCNFWSQASAEKESKGNRVAKVRCSTEINEQGGKKKNHIPSSEKSRYAERALGRQGRHRGTTVTFVSNSILLASVESSYLHYLR